MSKRCIFILFCATTLFARVPAADGYTVIVLAISEQQGAHHETYAYAYRTAKAAGSGTSHHLSADISRSAVEQIALKRCRRKGGDNPKIVLSTGEHGYFAIAVSEEQKGNIVGWSDPLPSPDTATKEAIANCEKRGGTDPRVKEQWRDYFHAGEKRPITAP